MIAMIFIDFLVFNWKGNSPLVLTEMVFHVRTWTRIVLLAGAGATIWQAKSKSVSILKPFFSYIHLNIYYGLRNQKIALGHNR